MARRLGLIGAGRMAAEHAKAARELGYDITAILVRDKTSDTSRNFTATFQPDSVDHDLDTFLARDFNALVVCPAWPIISKQIQALIRDPRPMLIEKPISLPTERLAALVAGAPKTQHNKVVAFNRRHYSTVEIARQLVLKAPPKRVVATLCDSMESYRHRFTTETGKWWLHISFATHLIDLLTFTAGPLTMDNVYASGPGLAQVLFHTESDAPVTLDLILGNPGKSGITLYLRDGTTLILSPLEAFQFLPAPGISPANLVVQTHLEEPYKLASGETIKPGILPQMRAFLEADYHAACRIKDYCHHLALLNRLARHLNLGVLF